MELEKNKLLYREHVARFLKYRLGRKLSNLITEYVLSLDIDDYTDERDAFGKLLRATVEYAVDGKYKVLPLVFDRQELEQFEENFLSIYDDAQSVGGTDSFEEIFDDLLADELGDILGKELVDTVKEVFMKAVLAIPEQTGNKRFYSGMQAIYTFIPDVWSELEFSEKVQTLSSKLPQDAAVLESVESEAETFEQLVEEIIVVDLAEIMGQGVVLQTVLKNAREKTIGIFISDQERFTAFCGHVLEDDMVNQLFDAFWVDERRVAWAQKADLICNAKL